MIDNKDIEKYRSIKAPSELKTRILRDCNFEERKMRRTLQIFADPRFVRRMSAVAACFLLVFVGFIALRLADTTPSVSYEGHEVRSREVTVQGAVPLSAKNLGAPSGVGLKVDAKSETTVTVSDGTLYIQGVGGEMVDCGTRLTVTKDTEIWWSVSGEEKLYKLTLVSDGESVDYTLEFKDDTPGGVLYKNK